jgi:thiamine biosynthesis lipoprotein
MQPITHNPYDATESTLWRVEQIMGMPIEIDIRDPEIDIEAPNRAFDWFRWVDTTFSTYRVDSQISRLNAGLPLARGSEASVREVLRECDRLREETQGYFDISTDELPVEIETNSGQVTRRGIDPSGLVKGWSVDRAGLLLEEAGARNYTINAGGDIRTRGAALPDTVWRVGIRHPIEREKLAAVVEANDLAIATSGAYERGEHIINPHTGRPPKGVFSVTITGPDLGTADAYATAAFAMEEEGPRWTMGLDGYESMTIFEDGTVLSTPGFPKV